MKPGLALGNGCSHYWVVVRPEAEGQYTARASGIPELSATAPTREATVEQVRTRIAECLRAGELELVEVPGNAWQRFSAWIDPEDPGEKVYLEELGRQRAEDLEGTLKEYSQDE